MLLFLHLLLPKYAIYNYKRINVLREYLLVNELLESPNPSDFEAK